VTIQVIRHSGADIADERGSSGGCPACWLHSRPWTATGCWQRHRGSRWSPA